MFVYCELKKMVSDEAKRIRAWYAMLGEIQ